MRAFHHTQNRQKLSFGCWLCYQHSVLKITINIIHIIRLVMATSENANNNNEIPMKSHCNITKHIRRLERNIVFIENCHILGALPSIIAHKSERLLRSRAAMIHNLVYWRGTTLCHILRTTTVYCGAEGRGTMSCHTRRAIAIYSQTIINKTLQFQTVNRNNK